MYLGNKIMDDMSMNIGQPKITPLIPVSQFSVVYS